MKQRTNAVDNEMYKTKGHLWWDDNESAATLRYFINPLRFAYFQRVIGARQAAAWSPKTVLDVGCGGGLLSEEFARAGFQVTGVDPAEESLECARGHAREGGLAITYQPGCGERIPAADETFDIVLCCDVLEHVDDLERVIREISRVLKPGGVFFYDTINRTWVSYLVVIKIMQDWTFTAQHEPRSHAWAQFVKPAELHALLASEGLTHQEDRGIAASGGLIALLSDLRRRVKGEISYRELGRRMGLHESSHLDVSYMGYAVKPLSPSKGVRS